MDWQAFSFTERELPSGVYDLVLVYQQYGLFCMKNANNLQEVWCSVDYSLILQAKFAERAKMHVKR